MGHQFLAYFFDHARRFYFGFAVHPFSSTTKSCFGIPAPVGQESNATILRMLGVAAFPNIEHICRAIYYPQVRTTVIKFVPVYMVNIKATSVTTQDSMMHCDDTRVLSRPINRMSRITAVKMPTRRSYSLSILVVNKSIGAHGSVTAAQRYRGPTLGHANSLDASGSAAGFGKRSEQRGSGRSRHR
jgi:hypothetical protein